MCIRDRSYMARQVVKKKKKKKKKGREGGTPKYTETSISVAYKIITECENCFGANNSQKYTRHRNYHHQLCSHLINDKRPIQSTECIQLNRKLKNTYDEQKLKSKENNGKNNPVAQKPKLRA